MEIVTPTSLCVLHSYNYFPENDLNSLIEVSETTCAKYVGEIKFNQLNKKQIIIIPTQGFPALLCVCVCCIEF